jgi:hypothetical protein
MADPARGAEEPAGLGLNLRRGWGMRDGLQAPRRTGIARTSLG